MKEKAKHWLRFILVMVGFSGAGVGFAFALPSFYAWANGLLRPQDQGFRLKLGNAQEFTLPTYDVERGTLLKSENPDLLEIDGKTLLPVGVGQGKLSLYSEDSTLLNTYDFSIDFNDVNAGKIIRKSLQLDSLAPISPALLAKLTSFSSPKESPLESFQDLDCLPNLTSLSLTGSPISSFGDSHSSHSLNLALHPSLTSLALNEAGLTASPDLTPFSRLSLLALNHNSLSSITLKNSVLTSVDLSHNAFEQWDLANEPQVSGVALNLSSNAITSLSLSGDSTHLESLNLADNALAALPSVGHQALTLKSLDLSRNAFKGAFHFSAVFPNLEKYILEGNAITALSLDGGASHLKSLSLGGSSITSFALLGSYPDLESISFSAGSNGSLTSFSISSTASLPGLKRIDLSNNPVSSFALSCSLPSLVSLNLAGTSLTAVDLSLVSSPYELILERTPVVDLTLSSLGPVKSLSLADTASLTTVSLDSAVELETLILDRSSLTDLHLSVLPSLRNVSALSCSLHNVKCSDLTALSTLVLEGKNGTVSLVGSFGKLQTVSFSGFATVNLGSTGNLPSLFDKLTTIALKDATTLYLHGDFPLLTSEGLPLTSAENPSFAKLEFQGSFPSFASFDQISASLDYLYFDSGDYGGFTNLDLTKTKVSARVRFATKASFPNLKKIDCRGNETLTHLEAFSSEFPEGVVLDCSSMANLTRIAFTGQSQLSALYVDDCPVLTFSGDLPDSLTYLSALQAKKSLFALSDFRISSASGLTYLNVGQKDGSESRLANEDLSKFAACQNLQYFDAPNNDLSSLSSILNPYASLKVIDVANNKFASTSSFISSVRNIHLKELYLGGNASLSDFAFLSNLKGTLNSLNVGGTTMSANDVRTLIPQLSHLKWLQLYALNLALTDFAPFTSTALPELRYIRVSHNAFGETMPPALQWVVDAGGKVVYTYVGGAQS